MAKMRIYDIARSLQEKLPDLKSKDLVALLQKNGFEVKSTQSSIEDDAIGFLLKYYQNKPAQAAKKEKAVSTAAKTKETAPKAAKEAPAAKEEKKEKAVKETLYKVLKNSIEYRTAHLDPTDMAGLQELLNKKKQIQRLA